MQTNGLDWNPFKWIGRKLECRKSTGVSNPLTKSHGLEENWIVRLNEKKTKTKKA